MLIIKVRKQMAMIPLRGVSRHFRFWYAIEARQQDEPQTPSLGGRMSVQLIAEKGKVGFKSKRSLVL